MDYRATLNLLQTDFPMKADLPHREPELVRWWQENDLYHQVRQVRAGAPRWILHDGPPYANGNIHLGQALNKILKDVAIKYQTLRGFDCPYVPGWDTQGLPTELAVQREYGLSRHEVSVLQWRAQCRELALGYVDIQREQFQRLGIRGDWAGPYLTLSPQYQARQIEAFGKMAARGLISRALRPIYWCYHCETALAEEEVEYETKTSPSIYVAFALSNAAEYFSALPAGAQAALVIWTTTPWTLPGNTGIALAAQADYALARCGERYLVLAADLLETTCQAVGLGPCEVLERKRGEALLGLVARHPLYDRPSPIVLGRHVVLDQGTGAVHTAPGHGLEDYQVGLEYHLPVISPLDDYGRFTAEAGPDLQGMVVDQSNGKILSLLLTAGALLHAGEIQHEYPHCWRCHLPIVYRATPQWFMDISQLRETALAEIHRAQWMPAWGEARIAGMVEARPDWCISRQRTWGVPIPAFHCAGCGHTLLTEAVANHVRDLVAAHERGADVWFEREAAELLPPGTVCPQCGGAEFTKEGDIMSVWFDSGVSHYCVLRTHPDLTYPADCYLEGDDQYQCWFQTSLWCATALGDPAPFKLVVGHAFFVDDSGQKLSKSKGNIISPAEIYDKYGADVLRLWFTFADFRRKMYCSPAIFEQVAEAYRRIRNTLRFLLANLADFDPAADAVAPEDLRELDRWALAQLGRLIRRVTEAFDSWDLHLYYHEVHAFCARELSSFYLDVLKDTLYTDLPDSPARRSAQTAMWQILQALLVMSAPVLTFTTEEAWQHCRQQDPRLPLSVQMSDWPTPPAIPWSAEQQQRWERLLEVREQVMAALEAVKQSGEVRKPLEAKVTLAAPPEDLAVLEAFREQLAELFIVSAVELVAGEALRVSAGPAEGDKCGRCWVRDPQVGADTEHPELCPRCAQRVRRLVADRP